MSDGSPPRVWGQPPVRVHSWVGHPVHPHGCGDNLPVQRGRRATAGSPPRVWGQRGGLTNARAFPRFTPTGVGTTSPKRLPTTNVVVYPHRCGDNIEYLANKEMGNGSPPRVWGQRLNRWPNLRHPRFTPTGVGTTRPSPSTTRPSTVHPHGCGDNGYNEEVQTARIGSPLRVWGQLAPRFFLPYDFLVHPHGCGDNVRIRGRNVSTRRFTPTGVGTTSALARGLWVGSVHPHGCGDNTIGNPT